MEIDQEKPELYGTFLWFTVYIHREPKTRHYILLSIALPNIDRFSKSFHHQTQQETYNKAISLKISLHLKCVATLPCEILKFKNRSNSVVSVGVSKLGYTISIFVDPGVKINGAYYRDVLLTQQLLTVIRQVSGVLNL